jgi:heterodisulfide reductase subunit B
VLLAAQKEGFDKLLCVCSMCYNTLKRTAQMLKEKPDKLRTLNMFLDDEPDYLGGVEVVHFLQVLRDDVGFKNVAKKFKRSMNGMKIAPYYGCLLLRPLSIAIDDQEHPTALEELLSLIGADVIDDPLKVECCGAHQTVHNKEVIAERTYRIVSSARERGAEAIALDCPLCDFNLDHRQKESERHYTDFFPMPVFYYTQLLALAMGIQEDVYGFEKHYVNPKSILKEHNLV